MAAPYIELHCHSCYSHLDGASSPLELAGAAAELGYPAIALTDHDGLWGSLEFAHACAGLGLRAITGAELTVRTARPESRLAHLTLLVEDASGYRNLCRLLTAAHAHTRDAPQRAATQPWVDLEALEAHAEGLICLSGCARRGLLSSAYEHREAGGAAELGARLLGAFGREGLRVELQRPYLPGDRARNRWLSGLAERLGVPCVASGDVHCHRRSRQRLQDAFVAVREGKSLEQCGPELRGNSTAALASPGAMAERFAEHPEAVAESARLAERLRFDIREDLGYSYPGAENPNADRELARACAARFEERYAGSTHRAEATERLESELATIRHLGLSGFFCLHREVVELAREVAAEVRGSDSVRSLLPPARGRGSSVSSIVCFLTGLSHVDPVATRLFPGRFLHEELTALPDIDIDLPRDIREALIPRVHERWGAEHSALVAAHSTYRPRGAVRDLAGALGLPAGEVERVARSLGHHGGVEEIERALLAAVGPERARSPRWRALAELAGEALGLPRHVSQHPGGMVIATRPLIDICPIVPAAMAGRQILQWDKDSCAEAGMMKIDLLGLGMLSAVERCVTEVERVRGERLDVASFPLDDTETWDAICEARATGFNIESRAQRATLPRTRPRTLEDLTVQVALVRPGPIEGGAIHGYIGAREALREDPAHEIRYAHPALEPVLGETLGAIVFQEQVLQVAIALAGFSAGEAEGLRRAMSKRRSEEEIARYRERFMAGCARSGLSEPAAKGIWEQMRGFSGFGFPKSHSRSFALLAWQTSYMDTHYRPEWLCSLLNEQPLGFYPPDALIGEAVREGVRMAPVDVNFSDVLCRVQRERGGLRVRLGLGYVKGVRGEEVEALVAERGSGGPYRGIAELAARCAASRESLEKLAMAGALDGLPAAGEAGGRRGHYWRAGLTATARRAGEARQLPLALEPSPAPDLEPLSRWEEMVESYRTTGVNLGAHPLALLRSSLGEGVLRSSDLERLPDGSEVELAGMVVTRQRPEAAKGMTFVLIEDERGQVNLIVPPPVYERRRTIARAAPLLRARGRLERAKGVTNVLVDELAALEWDTEAAPQASAGPNPPVGDLAARRAARERALAELRAVAPQAPSFGRHRG